MKNNKGFTLIEMLVVIAVVGILSAAVLTALGPSRNKAKDSRIQSGISQVVVLAETAYDGNNYPASLTAFPTSTQSNVTAVVTDIKSVNGNVDLTYNCTGTTGCAGFAVSSPLTSGGSYCADSSGKRGTQTAASGVCP